MRRVVLCCMLQRATCRVEASNFVRWLQRLFDFNATAIRWPFDCLSKVIKVTVTKPASRSHADLCI